MAHVCINSQFGSLSLFEDAGALVVLEWGRAPIEVGEGGGDPEEVSTLLAEAKDQLSAFFQGRLREFDLPLKPQGTDFQMRVWVALQKIPYGHTKIYGEVASELASGARAVGAACGRNPLPILIPCHRVVGAAGGLGGYTGGDGIETKRALLRLENSAWSSQAA